MKPLLPIVLCFVCAGCFDPTALQVSGDESVDDKPVPAEDAGPAEARQADPPAAPVTPVIPDVPAQVVDKQAALAENPGLREVDNGINAMDPVSAAAQSYFALASRVHLLNFKHQIDIMRQLNDRYPTFDEFAEMMQVHQVEFKGLKPWQMYAYDSSDGTVCILEDPEVKRARYEAAGIEYEE